MRSSTILSLGLAALASSTPIETRADKNYFAVTNFVYGCTTTCDYSFDVTIVGSAVNHPPVSTPVTCSGSTGKQKYKQCTSFSDNRSISAYIDKDNELQMRYEVNKPKKGERYNCSGHKHVNAETSGKPQKKKFKVVESSATGIA